MRVTGPIDALINMGANPFYIWLCRGFRLPDADPH
jgi:hypothetical protein